MNCGMYRVERLADERDRRDLEAADQELRQERDDRQVDRADQRDARQDRVDVLRGPLARPDAGDEPAVLPHVLRDVIRIEDDRGVEVAEEDDPDDVEQVVQRHPVADLVDAPGASDGPSGTSAAIVAGNARIDEAKMTGMTPPVFTFSGMCVLEPPYIRRPTTRLAYCTVTRRWPRSTNTIARDDQHHQHHQDQRPDAGPICPVRICSSVVSTACGKPTTMPA